MAWKYSRKEFIKVYRKFMEWEWYTDTNTKSLFLHCLLKANWKAGSWKGIHYEAGEFITSLPSICEETGLTMRQARTALSRLQATGELTSKTTDKVTGKKLTKNRIITVNNWSSYQGGDRQNDSQNDRQLVQKAAGKRQAKRQQIEEYKEIQEGEEIYGATAHTFPPTLSEVSDYIAERGLRVTAERFWRYYEAKEWTLANGRRMTKAADWHGALESWKEDDGDRPAAKARETYQPFDYERKDLNLDAVQRELARQSRITAKGGG